MKATILMNMTDVLIDKLKAEPRAWPYEIIFSQLRAAWDRGAATSSVDETKPTAAKTEHELLLEIHAMLMRLEKVGGRNNSK